MDQARAGGNAVAGARRPLPYVGGLDGLRALAVIAVVLYHADFAWLPGGFLGVEVFFVISGYIITAGLVREWHSTGRIDIAGFWLRRARRLLPALGLLLLGTMAFAAAFLPEASARVQRDAWYAATYVTNWHLIFGHTPYFEGFGRPPLLRHLWSLAVEEQFYIVWPMILALLLRVLRPRFASVVLVVVAAASALLMALLYRDGVDPMRLYYASDTRASGLLLGAAFALAFRPEASPRLVPKALLNLGGVAALIGLGFVFLSVGEFAPILYQGGFALVGLLTVCAIATVVHGGRFGDFLLGAGLLRWIGVRSYSIYLWHWPVFAVTRPELDVSFEGWALLVVRLAIVMGLAHLSYSLIEKPMRERGLAFFIGRGRAAAPPRSKRAMGLTLAGVGLVAICVSATVTQSSTARASRSTETPPVLTAESVAALNTVTLPEKFYAFAPDPNYEFDFEPPVAPPAAALPDPEPTPPQPPRPAPTRIVPIGQGLLPAGVHVTAIGDSVLLGAAAQLRWTLGNIEVDAEVGRQVWSAVNVVRARQQGGGFSDVVLLHLGNNGSYTRKEMDQILDSLSGVKLIVMVNISVPRSWEAPNNTLIDTAVGRPNVVVVDWHGAAGENYALFASDHVHLSGEGARLYSNLVATAILNNLR